MSFFRTRGYRSAAHCSHLWCLMIGLCVGGCNQSMQPVQEVELPERCTVMEVSDDSQVLALGTGLETTSGDNQKSFLILMNARTMEPITAPVDFDYWVSHIEFVSEEFGFLVGVSNEFSTVLDVAERTELQSHGSIHKVGLDGSTRLIAEKLPMPFTSMAVSPDHKIAAVCSAAQFGEDATCRFINLENGKTLSTFSPSFCETLMVTFSDDSQYGVLVTNERHSPAVGQPEPTPDERWTRMFLVAVKNGDLVETKLLCDSNGRIAPPLKTSHTTGEHHVLYSRDVASFTVQDKHIVTQQVFRREGNSLPRTAHIFNFDFDPINKRLALADTYDGSNTGCNIWFVDVPSRKLATCRIARNDRLFQVKFTPDGLSLFALVQVTPRFRSVIAKYDLSKLSASF